MQIWKKLGRDGERSQIFNSPPFLLSIKQQFSNCVWRRSFFFDVIHRTPAAGCPSINKLTETLEKSWLFHGKQLCTTTHLPTYPGETPIFIPVPAQYDYWNFLYRGKHQMNGTIFPCQSSVGTFSRSFINILQEKLICVNIQQTWWKSFQESWKLSFCPDLIWSISLLSFCTSCLSWSSLGQ